MIAQFPMTSHEAAEIDAIEVERSIEDATCYQIRDLDVSIVNDQVQVLGVCATYYLKQMVTVAVRELLPESRLLNQVQVCAS